MGALKAALTAIFNAHGNNDFNSTSKVPYFNSSNNPYGMVTPDKLASVLGVKRGYFGNTSTSQVVTTKANSNGLLIIGDLSTGGYGFYVIANMVPILISQMYNDNNINFSVEKDGNSLIITRTSTASPGYDNLHYAYLEAY